MQTTLSTYIRLAPAPGMQMFFKTHKCGWLCKKLGLKDIGEYKEPTLRCYIPGRTTVRAYFYQKCTGLRRSWRGSTNVLAGLHGKEATDGWIMLDHEMCVTTGLASFMSSICSLHCREQGGVVKQIRQESGCSRLLIPREARRFHGVWATLPGVVSASCEKEVVVRTMACGSR